MADLKFSTPPTLDEIVGALQTHNSDFDKLKDLKISANLAVIHSRLDSLERKPAGLSATDVDAKIASAIANAKLAQPAPADEDFWGSIEAFFRRNTVSIIAVLVLITALAIFWPRHSATPPPSPTPDQTTHVQPPPAEPAHYPEDEADRILNPQQ